MNAQATRPLEASKPQIDFHAWRDRLNLFDPEGELGRLVHGIDDALEEHYEDFYWTQIELTRRDPKLAAHISDDLAREGMPRGVELFKQRFTPPLSEEWAQYVSDFGRLMVNLGASTHVAMAVLSCAYKEAQGEIIQQFSGSQLRNALRAIHMLTSIESDVMISAMHDELQSQHHEVLNKQASNFESQVVGSVDQLMGMSGLLRKGSASALEKSNSLKAASTTVASAAEQSANAMREANKSIDLLEKTIGSVTTSIHKTEVDSARATAKASEVAAAAEQAKCSSREIATATSLIRGITDQVQILSLNATIEAARAGSAGAGFSVVASEVKQLAERTRAATSEIETEVQELLMAADNSSHLARDLSTDMQAIEDSSGRLNAEVSKQQSSVKLIVDAVSESLLSAEHIADSIGSINGEAIHVSEHFSQVDEKLGNVESLLDVVLSDMREYKLSFETP